MKDKVLVSFSSYNAPHFLEHILETYERIDPGYPCDLLILDNSNTDPKSLKILEKYAGKYRVETKPNYGRAQHGYNYAWENNREYGYHFFLHDDSSFIRDGWLKIAVDRINDDTLEKCIPEPDDCQLDHSYPIGKVGFQTYEWGTKYKYLRTGHRQVFHYMDPIAEILNIKIPHYYQHINDDKILYTKECLDTIRHIWNIEDWKQMEFKSDEWGWRYGMIQEWFEKNGLDNKDPFPPFERYGSKYHTFQTVSEFLNDINPMINGFRTHCVIGDGYCQEEAGWSNFRGNEYIAHYGDHVVFKRLSLLLKQPEQEIRKRFKDKIFLTICDNLIKKDIDNANKKM